MAELLNETTALDIKRQLQQRGKKIGNDGNTGRETKQAEIGDGRDENIFPLRLVWYITFWFYVFSEVC